MEKERVKIKELAEKFDVSQQSIRNYVKEGMPTFSVKPYRFVVEDCLEWLQNRGRSEKNNNKII